MSAASPPVLQILLDDILPGQNVTPGRKGKGRSLPSPRSAVSTLFKKRSRSRAATGSYPEALGEPTSPPARLPSGDASSPTASTPHSPGGSFNGPPSSPNRGATSQAEALTALLGLRKQHEALQLNLELATGTIRALQEQLVQRDGETELLLAEREAALKQMKRLRERLRKRSPSSPNSTGSLGSFEQESDLAGQALVLQRLDHLAAQVRAWRPASSTVEAALRQEAEEAAHGRAWAERALQEQSLELAEARQHAQELQARLRVYGGEADASMEAVVRGSASRSTASRSLRRAASDNAFPHTKGSFCSRCNALEWRHLITGLERRAADAEACARAARTACRAELSRFEAELRLRDNALVRAKAAEQASEAELRRAVEGWTSASDDARRAKAAASSEARRRRAAETALAAITRSRTQKNASEDTEVAAVVPLSLPRRHYHTKGGDGNAASAAAETGVNEPLRNAEG